MDRQTPTTWARSVIAACAIAAVGTAVFGHVLWRWLLDRSFEHSDDVAMWVSTVVAPLPACLALLAVVLTARAPAGTAIAVVAGVIGTIANLGEFRSLIGTEDYLRWLLWAVVLGCALLGADVLAWRLGAFTVATGALAGVVVAVLGTLVRVAVSGFWRTSFSSVFQPTDFWVREYALPALLLVLVGTFAGAMAQRRGVRQETAGVG
jgi:hypothetical protein